MLTSSNHGHKLINPQSMVAFVLPLLYKYGYLTEWLIYKSHKVSVSTKKFLQDFVHGFLLIPYIVWTFVVILFLLLLSYSIVLPVLWATKRGAKKILNELRADLPIMNTDDLLLLQQTLQASTKKISSKNDFGTELKGLSVLVKPLRTQIIIIYKAFESLETQVAKQIDTDQDLFITGMEAPLPSWLQD